MNVLLIRHAETDAVGRYLAGRGVGVRLNDTGRRQAERLEARLSRRTIDAIYTSPQLRARETIQPFAEKLGARVVVRDDLAEVDFGAWTGMTFEALQGRPDWQEFNAHRAAARPPGGEPLPAVQARVVAALDDLEIRHERATVVLVSHAEVIRCAVLHYLAIPLDRFQRIEISPASITSLVVGEDGPRFLCINEQDW